MDKNAKGCIVIVIVILAVIVIVILDDDNGESGKTPSHVVQHDEIRDIRSKIKPAHEIWSEYERLISDVAKIERGREHLQRFQDVGFANPQYQPRVSDMLSAAGIRVYTRYFRASITEHLGLPACRFTVTFRGENQEFTEYDDFQGWAGGQEGTIEPGNQKLTFEPIEIIAEISFPDSTFFIRETFDVDAQGKLRSRGIIRQLR